MGFLAFVQPNDPESQAIGLKTLHRLTCCPTCQLPSHQTLVGEIGAMPAALNAIELLNQATAAASDDDMPMYNNKEDDDDQHYLREIADGIKFLHTMMFNNKLNLEQVASFETTADVIGTVALSSCQRHPSSRNNSSSTSSTILTLDYCILILTELICHAGASTTQIVSAAENICNLTLLAIQDTAADSVRPIAIRSLTLALSKLWSVEGDEATVQIVKKISLAAICMVRDGLEHCKNKDDPVVRHSLDLLVAVAAVPAASKVMVQECCAKTISAIEDVAQQALERQTQSIALRAMYVLLRKGCNPEQVSKAASSWLPLLLATWRGYTISKSEQQQSTMMNAVAVQAFGAALLAFIPSTSTNATELLSAITATCCLLEQCYPLLLPVGSATPTPTIFNTFAASLPGDVFNGTSGQLHQQSLHAVVIPIITDAVLDGLRQLLSLVSNSNDMHDHNLKVDIAARDKDGYTLLHRLAAAGMQPCVQLLVSSSPPLDILARTLTGANALQLAREGKHMSCVALLEPLTEVAAAARQEELLRELEESYDKAEGNNNSKKAGNKKKKSITRSSSFFTEQPDEKTQKLDVHKEEDDVKEADECQRMTEERLRREEEYEKALEQRRIELEAMKEKDQQQQLMAKLPASDKDPETPDNMSIAQPDGVITTTSSSNDGLHDCSSSDEAPPAAVFETSQVEQQQQQQQQQLLQGDGPGNREKAVPRNASMTSLDVDFSALTARLQDALFVHDDDGSLPPHFAAAAAAAGGGGGAGMAPPLMKQDEAALQQTLFASLRGMSVGNTNGHSSFFPVTRGEETDPYSLLGLAPPPTSQSNVSHHYGSGAAAAAVLSSLGPTHPHHQQLSADMNGDECSDPTRHLWIGNLSTLTPRPLLKAIFARFGVLDDVITFPGRMYAFVNYRTTPEAMNAFSGLHDVCVPELTGDKRMLIKYRPVKKAAAHLRALGLADEDGEPLIMAAGGGLIGPAAAAACGGVNVIGGNIDVENLGPSLGLHSSSSVDMRQRSSAELDRDGNSSAPSPRIWLGNIAANARNESLHTVLSRYGPLTDAAVFPARIGPLGYAFVKFERLDDAKSAFDALNNTIVPLLSGSKQLKMRYKPADNGPPGREPGALDPSHTIPSRHLWLGNVTQKPTEEVIGAIFSEYGTVDSVRVFPVKAFAFVNFSDISAAIRAVTSLEGRSIICLTGVKPLVMRYQHEVSPLQPTTTVATSSASIIAAATPTAFPPPSQQLGARLGTANPSMILSQLSLPSNLDLSGMCGGGGSPATVPSLMMPPPLSHPSSDASMLVMPPPSHTSSNASVLMASPNNKDALWVGGNSRNYNTTTTTTNSLFSSNSSGGYGFDAQAGALERMMMQEQQHAANMMNMSLPPRYDHYEHDATAAAAATQSQLNSLLTNLTALQFSGAISKPQQANTNNEMQMQQLLATLLAQQQQQTQAPNAPWMNGWS